MNIIENDYDLKEVPVVIVCDESTTKGNSYSFFYGGAMIKEEYYEEINNELDFLRNSLYLHELKRSNIDLSNADRYNIILNKFFDYVYENKINVRIMFTDNRLLAKNTFRKNDITFNKFYYFFIRYAFGLAYLPYDIKLRIIFDELPDKKIINDDFKNHLVENISNIDVPSQTSHVSIKKESIEEVDSRKHLILQCCDVIVGLIDFFVNEFISENYLISKRQKGRYIVLKRLLNLIDRTQDSSFDIFETTRGLLGRKNFLMKYAHYLYKPKKIKKFPSVPTSTNHDQRSPSAHKENY